MLTIEKKSLKVGKYVGTSHVDTVIRNYKQERWKQNSERLGKEDTLSLWYSIEELEEFIQKSKQSGANGIRLYFGAYSAENAEKPGYEGMQTAVFVANKHKETEEGFEEKNVYVHTEGGPQVLAYNMGQGCPLYCGGKKTGDDDWGGIGVTIVDLGDKGIKVI